MTGIHDLLTAVSSGQPVSAVSVDDLVRTGRRRQRTLVSAVATGTAAVVALAVAASAGALQSRDPASDGGGASTSGTFGPSPSYAPVPTPSPYDGPRVVVGADGATSSIPTAHLLNGDRTVATTVDGPLCATTSPDLTVVDQTATEVRIKLRITGGAAQTPKSTCGGKIAAPPSQGSTESAGSQQEQVTLQAALGTRLLVDAATGKTIPYLSSRDAVSPTYLPQGFVQVGPVAPAYDGWSTTYRRGSGSGAESLNLEQVAQAADLQLGKVTTTVDGQPASVLVMGSSIDLRWQHLGGVLDLWYSSCRVPINASASSYPCIKLDKPALSQSELLKVAASIGKP